MERAVRVKAIDQSLGLLYNTLVILTKLKLGLSLLMIGLTMSMPVKTSDLSSEEQPQYDEMKEEIRFLKAELTREVEYREACAKGSKRQLDRLCLALDENVRLKSENSALKEGVNYAGEKNMELDQKICGLREEILNLKRTASLAYKISEAIIDLCNCFHAPCFAIFPVRIRS